MEDFEIRKIQKNEIPLIKDFQPPGWTSDLENVWNLYYDEEFFYPMVATINGEIIGTGIAVINKNAAWLGHIIVKESHRNRGIGNAITKHLINLSKSKNIDSVILTASELGLPIYQKIGFQHDIDYIFFKSDINVTIDSSHKKISPILKEDHEYIFELDYDITGEKRKKILATALTSGFKYINGKMQGFFLPNLGNGLIIAESEIAGIELLMFRFSRNSSAICIPETNKIAIEFVNSLGFYPYLKVPRMFLNKNVNWHPENVFSRGCGYMG